MRALIACERSGKVRRAMRALGVDAYSCDLEPSDDASVFHYQRDVIDVLDDEWDLLIGFPPCTHLASSGARWFETKQVEQRKAIWFFKALADAPIAKVAIENPIGIMSTLYRKPDQIIQPWQFGHGETKATCLWLRGLPCLYPTNIVAGREPRIHHMPPSADRGRLRSVTYDGIAEAMAAQWGVL